MAHKSIKMSEILAGVFVMGLFVAIALISFKEFLRNPIVALLFMCLMAIGYLYIDNKNNLTDRISVLQEEVKILKDENRELNSKIIEILIALKEKNE